MNLAFDIDGCLARFELSYGKALLEVTGRNLLPDGWETSPDFPQTWYWERDAGYTKEEERATWEKAILTSDSFWRELTPLPGAEATLRQINRLATDGGHNVYFITHRMGKQVKLQTEHFLLAGGMQNPTVLLSGDKAPLLNALGIEFFIDDKLETIQDVAKKCKVKYLFLKDAPYNRVDVVPSRRAVSVEAALREAGLWLDKRPVGRPKKGAAVAVRSV